MSETYIEIVKPCEHGHTDQREVKHAQSTVLGGCYGGQRVRYTRQEAIDLMGAAMHEQADPFCDQLVGVGVDALLGASE